jgi:ABC-type sugar transport system substrate-binding protein
MRFHALLASAIGLLLPVAARAQAAKDPLSYPIKQYGFVLGMALMGGLVGWYAKVRKGEAQAWNITQLVGELCTSAFAGLLCFWLCELVGAPALLGACLVGVAGHMGTRAITAFEAYAMKRWGSGIEPPTDPKG